MLGGARTGPSLAAAPSCTAVGSSGRSGTPVVVNLWASWCAECNAEAPTISAAASRYAGKIQFVGVDILDARPSAQGYIAKYAMSFPSVFDPQDTIGRSWGLIGQPNTLFFDAAGRKIATVIGPVSATDLDTYIQKIRVS